jgi:hypothetical protein
MLNVDWKKTLPYLAVILIFGGYALSIPHSANFDGVNFGSDHGVANFTLEGVGTAIIAIFAIFQYFEFRKSSERQLRAYVLVQIAEFSIPPGDEGKTQPWAIQVGIQNFGKTPAYQMAVAAEGLVGVAMRDEEIAFQFTSEKQIFSPSVLGPGAHQTVRLNKGLDNGANDLLIHRGKNRRAYV